jgi:hypothetical protein
MNEGFAAQNKIYETLGPKFEELSKRTESDKRILAMMRTWSVCMKKVFIAENKADLEKLKAANG